MNVSCLKKLLCTEYTNLNIYTVFIIFMATITLSIPEDLRKKMRKFNEINWSAVSRNAIEKKIAEQEMLKKMIMQEEKELEWTIDLGRKAKKGVRKRLEKEGFKLS